jgi:hypothetical protein
MNRPANFLVAIVAGVFLTSSFDVFLNVDVGPNIRIGQLLGFILIAAAALKSGFGRSMQMPLGGHFLIAWLAVQLAFVPVAAFWEKSLGYCIWLAFSIALSFAFVTLFVADTRQLQTLLRLYLLSFVSIAGFGIIQFVLPLAGGPAPLVEQWWLPGRVPRVNGFSYEPSYYATYLIIGLTCLGSLRRSGIQGFRTWKWSLAYALLATAMILCSSRIGVAFLILELLIAPLKGLWAIIRSPRSMLAVRVSGWRILAASAALCLTYVAFSGTLSWYTDNREAISILASGTGLLGTASHSVEERENHLHDTLKTIADHPWMGQSLGGVTESVAGYIGTKPMNFEETKSYEGQSVFAEAAAASGLPGSIPFFCFVIVSLAAPLRLARRAPPAQAAWLRALAQSLIFEWAILQFNQNILRMYLWVHIAVLATVYASTRLQYGEAGESPVAAGGYDSPNLLA